MAAEIQNWLGEIPDPEIPVLSILDLGIVRKIEERADGEVAVTITPTYSGCPAMDVIREQIQSVLHSHGVEKVKIETTLTPAWTTDWIPDSARQKLREYGIAPPGGLIQIDAPVNCPRCGSADTQLVSRFASTACKAHYKCRSCLEPFDAFKRI
jgi:ring-1,2-phenylacetyl-CoA epoxidase subunit PaaD